MSTLSFLVEGLRNLRTTGTFTRSSPALCEAAIDRIDFSQAKVVVELGAGDGVITKHLLKRLPADAKVIAFEVSPELCDDLRSIKDERLIVAEDSAENLQEWLAKAGTSKADHVISALPFSNIPEDIGRRIVQACKECLQPGGAYNQVHYSLKTKAYYEAAFGRVDAKRVWSNLPPAWVLYCRR